ncbi:MAG: glycosyltransferase family 39 protein [Terrimicrobiaceae bacterium]
MKPKILFPALLLMTALRVVWVLTHDVAPVEAYYWMCSQHLAAGYFDGPSGTALLVRAFGSSFEMARVFWPMLGLYCSVAAWLFARRIYDATIAGWCVIFLNVLPVFNSAAVTVGPLLPALTSILTGLVFARMAWDGRKWAWLGAGFFFALALLFRYEAILVPFGLLAGALAGNRHRTLPDAFGLVAVAGFCALALWPALSWNASLEWIPIAGGTWRTLWEFRWGPFLTSLAGFAAAFSVPGVGAIVIALWLLIRDAQRHSRAVFILAACGIVWAWAFYVLLRGGDATIAGFLAVVPLAAFVISEFRNHRLAVSLGSFVVIVALLTTAICFWSAGQNSWKPVAAQVREAARDLPASEGGGGFYIAEDANMAAVLGYYLPGEAPYPPVFIPESPDLSSQFGIWPSYADFVESDRVADEYFTEQKGINPFIGRNAIYVGYELPQTIKGAFEQVQPLRSVVSPDGRELTIYVCLGYQTLPL